MDSDEKRREGPIWLLPFFSTFKVISKGNLVICKPPAVPHVIKTEAVLDTIMKPVPSLVPATILRIPLDKASASGDNGSLQRYCKILMLTILPEVFSIE